MSKDEQLIKALLHPSKKEQAFNTLVRLYKERLYWHIRKMVQLISLLEGVITPQQTIKLLMAEEDFKKRLLKRFRGRNQNRKDKP